MTAATASTVRKLTALKNQDPFPCQDFITSMNIWTKIIFNSMLSG